MLRYSQDFINELTTASQIKAAIYSYFYTIFQAPVNDTFLELTCKFIPSFKELGAIIDTDNMKTALVNLEKYNNDEQEAKDKTHFLNKLNQQYTSLFLLGLDGVPTSASVYLSPDRLLKGDPWVNVCQVYSLRDFKIPEGFNEPDDHIAIETLYMEKLNALTIKLINNNSFDDIPIVLSEQKEFLADHLLTWVKDFSEMTKLKSADKPLYCGAALLLAEFAEYDLELIKEFIEEA